MFERTTAAFRVLAILLAALALVLDGQRIDAPIVALGLGYLVFTVVLALVERRVDADWLPYPTALVDVAAVAALIALVPAALQPLWALFLFPVVTAAVAGKRPALLAAGCSAASLAAATLQTTGALPSASVWPLALILAGGMVFALLPGHWLAERDERRAWREVAAAARALISDADPEDVAALVAERARRLVRADDAWIWWLDGADRVRPGPRVGAVSSQPPALAVLPPRLLARPDRSAASLAEVGQQFDRLEGDVVALQPGETPLALLAVAWTGPAPDRTARRKRLRIFAPWAADALAQAQARLEARERLHRETVLRDAAADLAATLDRAVAERVVVESARAGIGAAIALIEPASRRLVAGDAEAADALPPVDLDADAWPPDAPLIARVADDLALVARRTDPPLGETEAAWLDELAALARAALERIAIHDQLRAEEQRLRTTLEELPAPVALWDAGGKLLLANAAYRALGRGHAPPAARAAGSAEDEVVLGDPPRTFMVTHLPVAEGQCSVSLYREITRERAALKARDELIALVGHELRTPLTSIHGYSQMMARHLEVVQTQVHQLNRLIGDFLEASRLGTGQLPLTREPIDLAELARQAVERFRGRNEDRGLLLDLEEDLPPVEGDPVRLGQVLDNLLENAAKYSPADQDIVVAVRASGGEVLLSVQDRGVGIPPEYLPNLFDRFFRVPDPDTEHVRGSGLGLSIVRDIVAAHGGRVWAESQGKGRGSTFWVALPARPDADRAASTAQRQRVPASR